MIIIPTKLIDKIDYQLSTLIEFHRYTEKQKNRLKKELIKLWYFIYNKQIDDLSAETLDFYTNINRNHLKKFRIKINNKSFHYSVLLDILKRSGIVSVNDKYRCSKFCKAYRIDTQFLSNTNYTEVEIDFGSIFKNLKNKQHWINRYPNHRNQIENCYNTKIDLDSYIHWLNNNIGKSLKPIIKNGIVLNRILTEERIFRYITRSLKVNFQNLWFKVSDTGRFYSNVVSLPSSCKPFLKLFKRTDLISIDIANCQPLLLASKIDSEYYRKDTGGGVFYNRLSDHLKRDRNDIKLMCFKYIFFSDRPLKSGIIYDAMETLYPSVIGQINDLKEEYKLSDILQRLESQIIVEKISMIFNLRVITRHDEILCYPEDQLMIENIIINQFKKLKLNVTLK